MKVLYYNWVDYEDPMKRGGGVGVYQKNLIDAAVAAGDEVSFLSSGMSYGLFTRQPYLRESAASGPRVRKFEIVNSTVLAPAALASTDSTACFFMEKLFADFLEQSGPFDAIHFNNLEGVPLSVVSVARRQNPKAKIVFSLHNYFPFCPEVNLWFQDKANCADFCEGRKCVQCVADRPKPSNSRKKYMLQTLLGRLGLTRSPRLCRYGQAVARGVLLPFFRQARSFAKQFRPAGPAGVPLRLLDRGQADAFVRRRAAFVEVLNRDADHVLAVSARVAELAVRFGLRADKVATSYIGTKFSRADKGAAKPAWAGDRPLSLAYLGYMRRDKGFYFLLKALEGMPARLADRINLTFAMKLTDPHAVDRLRRIAHKFGAVTLMDGYTHATLPELLSGVDLGVVPVLWEDNLPQVAIEMVGSGVPILTSDLGGARELLNCPELTFTAGSHRDFLAKLEAILDRPDLLGRAMAGRAALFSPEDHYRDLRAQFYSGVGQADARRRLSA